MGGQLWHTIRNPDGSWQPSFGLIEAQVENNPGSFDYVSCTGVGSDLHVVGIVGGQLWHTIRHSGGSWQPSFGLIEAQVENNPGAFSIVDCGGVGSSLHVVGLAGGQLFHTIRNPDGSWQHLFGQIEAQSHAPNPFQIVSCAGVGATLHVAGVSGGSLSHTIRNPDGSWQPEFDAYNPPGGPGLYAISCGGVGTALQVVGVSNDRLYHTIWNPGGNWQQSWGLIEGQVTEPNPTFVSVGCSGIGSALHVVGRGGTDLYHTIRNPDESWQPSFDVIETEVTQNNPNINLISCAGVGSSLHLVGSDV